MEFPLHTLGVERRGIQPAEQRIRRGSVFHEVFDGSYAAPFMDDGHFSFSVSCKEEAGVEGGKDLRYGIVVTLESGDPLPIYEEIRNRVIVPVRPA